jgi:hypothetical protein
MRGVFVLTVALFAGTLQADEATLGDGRRLKGTLGFADDRLKFTPSDGPAVAISTIENIRFSPAVVAPFLSGAVHQIRLPGGQHITCELQGFADDKFTFRSAWAGSKSVHRSAVRAVTNLPGELILVDEDFENGLKNWKLTGAPSVSEKLQTSGKVALLLDKAGQAAVLAPPSSPERGRIGLNFHVPETVGGARWLVEADFGGERPVRFVVADTNEAYTVETAVPRDEGGAVIRRAGWHHLAIEFSPSSLLVTVDDSVLWYNRTKGPGKALTEIRFVCSAVGAGPVSGAVAFDDLVLASRGDVPIRPSDVSPRDEVWLASGDQLFGSVTRLDRRGVELTLKTGKQSYSWAEARGVFLQHPPTALQTTNGEHVRLYLRPSGGTEPDVLEGVLRSWDDRRLTLRHGTLGDLDIERAHLKMLKPLFFGRRVELENGVRQLGEKGRLLSGQSIRAEGPTAEYTFRLETLPNDARLMLLAAPQGEGNLVVRLNGHTIEALEKFTPRETTEPMRLVVPLPRGQLKKGENTLEVTVTEKKRGAACSISELALELPEQPD